ncbi:hypothetical protein ACS0PU_000635 [Formica fusca]
MASTSSVGVEIFQAADDIFPET